MLCSIYVLTLSVRTHQAEVTHILIIDKPTCESPMTYVYIKRTRLNEGTLTVLPPLVVS